MLTQDQVDAKVLRTAAAILRRRSTRPKSWLLSVYCQVLEQQAIKLEQR